jgi:hypothetical protein
LYGNGALAAAARVQVRDQVTHGRGEVSLEKSVTRVRRAGLYNPQTIAGDVVVDGMLIATYTTAVEPAVAHALLLPFRLTQVWIFQDRVRERRRAADVPCFCGSGVKRETL